MSEFVEGTVAGKRRWSERLYAPACAQAKCSSSNVISRSKGLRCTFIQMEQARLDTIAARS